VRFAEIFASHLKCNRVRNAGPIGHDLVENAAELKSAGRGLRTRLLVFGMGLEEVAARRQELGELGEVDNAALYGISRLGAVVARVSACRERCECMRTVFSAMFNSRRYRD